MRPKIERLKDRAWKVFSIWIRKRDGKCVSCRKYYPFEELQAGHFWHNVLDFDEENINAQCIHCNHYKSGNLAEYSIYLLEKLGTKKFKALDIRHTLAIGGEKHNEEYYENIIKKYKV